jgi:hypothetical protein
VNRLSLAAHPRRTLGTLAVVLVAVGITVGSGASFTASAANPGNIFATGTLSIGNSPSTALFNATGLKPGDVNYRFAVTFPGGGALDNQLQGASTTVSYVWSAGPVAPAPQPTATPPASAPPSTLGTTTVPRPAPTERLLASARQRGRAGKVQVQLVCSAACRARFTATAHAAGATVRVRAVSRTLRRPGRVTVRLALPRRARAALSAWRTTTVRVSVRVSIGGRNVMLRKTVRPGRKPGRGRARA